MARIDEETVSSYSVLSLDCGILMSASSFLERALESVLDFEDEDLEAEEGECPVCGDRTFSCL